VIASPAPILVAVLVSAPVEARTVKSAVIIGVNEPFEQAQAALRYADDDAARFWEMLSPDLDEVELLTILDPESQKLFPEAAKRARAPDRANLLGALDRAFARAKAAKASGARAELYFIYTGHGRVSGGEGEVKLHGGALTRSELTDRLLKSAVHDRTHVIVDACNAYHLLNARGPEGAAITAQFDEAFERFVEEQSIDRYPTVGVVLSTSGAGATHEWSRYQGGVFSHEVRSALSGAADADQNGRIDYTEVEAFIASANLAVPELKGRPKVFVRAPPIDRAANLVEGGAKTVRLELPEALAGHYWVEDDRGLRYAELNKAEGHRVLIDLVPRARYLLVRSDGAEVAHFEGPAGLLRLPVPLDIKAPDPERMMRARGEDPADDLHVFEEPFGPRFVAGYRARLDAAAVTRLPVEEGPSISEIGGFAAGGVALVALAGGILESRRAAARFDDYWNAGDAGMKDAAGQHVDRYRRYAVGFYVAAGVSAVASALLLVLGSD
jgi:caspase domain-containing protein